MVRSHHVVFISGTVEFLCASVDDLFLQSKAAPNHITSQFEKAKSFIQESLKTVAVSRLLLLSTQCC